MSTDPAFAALARQSTEQGYFRLVGAEMTALGAGHCTVALAKRGEVTQINGFIHGGAIAFLVDVAMTTAAATHARPDEIVLTSEFKLNFVSPAAGERIVCRAVVVKPGRRLIVTRAEVFSVMAGVEKICAVALGTTAIVPKDGGRDRD